MTADHHDRERLERYFKPCKNTNLQLHVSKGLKPAAHERTCRAYLLFVTSWVDKISSCAGNIYGIFVIRDM